MAAHRKPRRLVLLAGGLAVLVAAAFGGFALAGSLGGSTAKLDSAAGTPGRGARLSRPSSSGLPGPAAQESQARPPAPSPSASKTPPPAAPPPASAGTQAGTTGSWAWCSSAALGQSPTFSDHLDLYNNEWNSSADPGPQTTCGNNGSDWQVTSTQRAGNTEVLTYPDVQLNYNSTNGYPLSRFTSMTSSYDETMNAVGGTDAEAAYDIWLNGLNKEVMVWVDDHGQTPSGSKVATTTFSGATWDLYVTSSGTYMAFVREGNAPAGTVDLLAALTYLEHRGSLSPSDVLWQVNFGWEICTTAGAPETFRMSSYSLTSSPAD
jgi:Glycosyl hydrolase family 12